MTTKDNATMPASLEAEGRMTTRAQSPDLEPLNTYELRAIKNGFAWVAEEQNAASETVRSVTESHFGVDDVAALPRKDYDEVIRFLVDLRLNEVTQ
jgi:hypothetical protein